MYAFLVASGVILWIWPTSIVEDRVGHVWGVIWAIDLTLSAVACLVGSFYDRWIGEYGFLPMLYAVLILYGLSAVIQAFETSSKPLLAFGLIILSFSSGLIARWQDVKDIKMSAEAYQKSQG
jgi:hypothetical protein